MLFYKNSVTENLCREQYEDGSLPPALKHFLVIMENWEEEKHKDLEQKISDIWVKRTELENA